MGFDLCGIKPINDDGKYFNLNISAWPLLWSLVCNYCGDILTVKQMEDGFYNSNVGSIVHKEQAEKIAKRMEDLLQEKKLHYFNSSFIEFAKNSGGFEIS